MDAEAQIAALRARLDGEAMDGAPGGSEDDRA